MTDKDEQKATEPEVDTDQGDNSREEVVFEDNTEVIAPDIKAKFDKLKAKIKELEKKNHELLDGWQRDKADFINTRKRDDEAKKQFLKFSKAEIISELIPVLDSFDGAFKNKEAWEKVDKNWRMGVEFIHTQLSNILAGHGLKIIYPMGEKYDPARDEAVENVKIDSKEDESKILEVVQPGYELNGKEIRPPKVKVGHYS